MRIKYSRKQISSKSGYGENIKASEIKSERKDIVNPEVKQMNILKSILKMEVLKNFNYKPQT